MQKLTNKVTKTHKSSVLVLVVFLCSVGWPQSTLATQIITEIKPEQKPDTSSENATLSPKEQLVSDEPKIRARGIQNVVQKRITQALPELEAMAKEDKSAGIRRLACWAIGELQLKGGMLTLRGVARNDPADNVRTAAKNALAKFGVDADATEAPQPLKNIGSCLKDTDCKGDRICAEGNCKDVDKYATLGWTTEAAVIGFIGTAAVGGLSIYAALNPENLLPAIPLAAGATLVTIIVAPSLRSGSLSVRDANGIPGSLTLRVIGWGAFGVHICASAALAAAIPFHWLKKDSHGEAWTPQTSWIMANSILGMVSLLALTIDTLVARKQSVDLQKDYERRHPKPKVSALTPFLAPVVTERGASGGTLGLAGRF